MPSFSVCFSHLYPFNIVERKSHVNIFVFRVVHCNTPISGVDYSIIPGIQIDPSLKEES